MRALLTGGTGFIGKALLDRLLQQKTDVTAIARHPPPGASTVHWVAGDVTRPETLGILREEKFDLLFHVAGAVTFDMAKRQELYAVNVEGTRNILDLAERLHAPRSIVVSSVASMGPAPEGQIADEETPFGWNRDEQPYSASKYDGERIAIERAKAGMQIVVVNPAFVFGEGDDHSPAMRLIQKIKRRKLPLYPPGGICVVWVGDVVSGILAAAERGRSGEKYVLGGENLGNREAYQQIASAAGGIRPLFPLPKSALLLYAVVAETEGRLRGRSPRFTRSWARSAGRKHFYSSDKARRELGYTPIDFRSTLERTVRWMREYSLL